MERIGRNAPCPCGSGKKYKHCCGAAAPLKPPDARGYHDLGRFHEARGETDAALASYRRALASAETPEFKSSFAGLVKTLDFRRIDPDVRNLVARALAEAWARPADLATTAIRLVNLDPGKQAAIARAAATWPVPLAGHELFEPTGPAGWSGDSLLLALLENAPLPDIALERFLTMARHALLVRALAIDGGAGEAPGAFDCALARQCLLNDFVFASHERESRLATSLQDRLAAALEAGKTVPALWVVAVAAYFPLLSLPLAETLLDQAFPAAVEALLAQHIAEPLQERQLRRALRVLTRIDGKVSSAVRQQYEEHPYPRWIKLPPPGAAISPEAYLRQRFPGVPSGTIGPGGSIEVLVAGCGTGRETIELARQIAGARVLAVDLSLASLGYAKRKALELGADNIEFAQADINLLHAIGGTFDLVSSVGVLHHLEDPLAGWRELLHRLRPGGFMIVGLYSETGRRGVVAARELIAKHGYAPDEAGIRQCREALMALDDGAPAKQVIAFSDFYVTGECRDLLFHVQEHRFTLPRIKENLASLGLTFHGFLVEPHVARNFVARYPDDPDMTDLDRWHDFETAFPATFAGMYVFLVRKPAEASA